MALLIKEFRARVDAPVRVVVGKPIEPAELEARSGQAQQLMDFLRQKTYELSPKPMPSLGYGFEFEERYKA